MKNSHLTSTSRLFCSARGVASLLAALLAVGSLAAQAAPAKIYRNVRGQLITLQMAPRAGDRASAIVDHEAIPSFMRAMRMAMPFQSAAHARRLKAGDKITFDMVLQKGTFLIANPRLLPKSTRLKLAKAPSMAMLNPSAGGH